MERPITRITGSHKISAYCEVGNPVLRKPPIEIDGAHVIESPLSEAKLTRNLIVSTQKTRELSRGVGGCSSTRHPRFFLYPPSLVCVVNLGLREGLG